MNNSQLYSSNNTEQIAAAEKFFNVFGEKVINEFGDKQISLLDIGSGCGTVLSKVILKRSGFKYLMQSALTKALK